MKPIKPLHERVREFKLQDTERAQILSSIQSFIEKNPISKEVVSPVVIHTGLNRHNIRSGPMPFISSHNKKTYTMTIALLLIVALAGGTSFAAQNALPGDTLYPVKIHINENIESFVAVGAEADARAEARHAIRRLDEARALQAENKLTADANARLEARFKADVEAMNKEVSKLKADGKNDAALSVDADFQSSLKQNQDVLGFININLNGSLLNTESSSNSNLKTDTEATLRIRLKALTEDLIQKESTSVDTSANLQAELTAKTALQAALYATSETQASFNKHKNDLSAESRSEIAAKLEQADKATAEGKIKLEAKMYGGAYADFKRAERAAGEATLTLMLSIQSDLNIGNILNNNTPRTNSETTVHSEVRIGL